MKRLYFMRHGQTDMNVARRLQGMIDCPLNETGVKQAIEAGERFKANGIEFDHVYSSPLSRAVDTAALATGIDREEVVLDERVVEQDFGPFEGTVYENFDSEMWAWLRDPEHVETPEGIESVHSLLKRTGDFIRSFVDADTDGNILVVTHSVAIRAILGNLFENREVVWGMPIENCVLYMTEIEDGKFTEPIKIELL